jgi:translation initiation factor IF-2
MAKMKEKTQTAYRPPIVSFLGHVDHGKTTILDKIRESSIQEDEEGGITQGISVYSVRHNDKDITFVDTPGHEAFDLMRLRGGSVADIVLLIVAANDGVKPQTKESIEIIKKAKKPVIVVINKIDLSGVDIPKVKRELANEDIIVESMGGDIPSVEVSGKTGKGIPELLDMIHLVAEVSDIAPKEPVEGTTGTAYVLESRKDRSRGNVSTIVVTAGSLTRGLYIGYWSEGEKEIVTDKIKGFVTDLDDSADEIRQGYGGDMIGLSGIVHLGDLMYGIDDASADLSGKFSPEGELVEELIPEETEESDEGEEDADLLSMMFASREESEDDIDVLNVVLKANTQGTLDAITKSLSKMVSKGLVNISRAEVGSITTNDIELAMNVGAIVLGFRVSIDPVAADIASKNRVLAKVYSIIYELTDEVKEAAEAMQLPGEVEETIGSGKVRKIFILSDGSKVLGLRVESGEMKHGNKCRVIRDKDVVGENRIVSMKCEKESIQKAGTGTECGVVLDAGADVEEGDILECYRIVKQ